MTAHTLNHAAAAYIASTGKADAPAAADWVEAASLEERAAMVAWYLENRAMLSNTPATVLASEIWEEAAPATETRTYYPLLQRDDMHSPWGVAFGDYDRETVQDELDDLKDSGVRASCLKIITTTDKQADIQAVVDHLNNGTH